MRIVLISLYNYESSGIRYISSLLNSNGHDAYLIYFKRLYTNDFQKPTDKEYSLLIDKINEINPDIIGISILCSSFSSMTKELAERLKNLSKPIIIGGVAPTLSPEDYIGYSDFICLGEGEYSLLELLNSLRDKKSVDNIKGLWIRKKGKIKKNSIRELADLDKLPIPLFPKDRTFYIDDNRINKTDNSSMYSLSSSRGCPYTCTYCCNNVFHRIYKGKGCWVRKKRVNKVIEELRIAKKENPGLKFIKFHDDIFLDDVRWLEEFKDKYKKEINLPFSAFGHFNFCNDRTMSLFKESGGYVLKIGIQSGSERIRNDIFKRGGYTNQRIVDVSRLIKKHKINVDYDLITDNPYENKKDKDETINLLLKMERPFRLNIHSLIYFPHTELTERALKDGIIRKDDVENKKQKILHCWISRLDLQKNRENLFYNSLYALTDSFIPKSFIRFLYNRKFLKNNPRLLMPLKYLRTLSYIPHAVKFITSLNIYDIERKIKTFK